MDQINNLEGFFRNELKKTRFQLETERDYRTRLETSLKYLEEQVKKHRSILIFFVAIFGVK